MIGMGDFAGVDGEVEVGELAGIVFKFVGRFEHSADHTGVGDFFVDDAAASIIGGEVINPRGVWKFLTDEFGFFIFGTNELDRKIGAEKFEDFVGGVVVDLGSVALGDEFEICWRGHRLGLLGERVKEVEGFESEGLEDEIEEVTDEAADEISNEVGDVGRAEDVEEGLESFDGEAEEEGEEEGANEAENYAAETVAGAAGAVGIFAVGEREEEAERDGHNDIEDDLASEVAVVIGDVDKGSHIHRDVGVVEDEREGEDDRH